MKRGCYMATAFLCVFELVRGSFDVLAGLARALDNAGDVIDPVLRKVVAVVPGGITVDAIGVLQGDGVDGEFAAKWSGVIDVGRNDIEPVDESGNRLLASYGRTFTYDQYGNMPVTSNS